MLDGAFDAGRQVDAADMNKSVNQFTYVEGDQCVSICLHVEYSCA